MRKSPLMLFLALALAFSACGDDEKDTTSTPAATTEATTATTGTTDGTSTTETTETERTTTSGGTSTEERETPSTTTTTDDDTDTTSQGEPPTGKVFPVRFVIDGKKFRPPTSVTVPRGYAIELIFATADRAKHRGEIRVGSKTYKLRITIGFDTQRIPAPRPGRYRLIADGSATATIVVR